MAIAQNDIEQAGRIAPAGFYIALHVGFSFPREEINRLPKAWIEFYTVNTLGIHDPVLRWFYTASGVRRWVDIAESETDGVIVEARNHGLAHGAAAVIPAKGGVRSYANFFRNDRPFTDAELDDLLALLSRMHSASADDVTLTPAEVEALRMQSEGKRLKQIAWELGISVSAVKARLANAKRKLGAQTASQAAVIAAARRIL